MKIKQKKQLNLPQLIEWAWSNNVKGEFFSIDKNEESGICFATNNDFMMKNADYIRYNNTFTVEVEEEITEDTVIPELVELYEDTLRSSEGSNEILVNKNTSIRRAKDVDECPSRAFYILNDDYTMTLIWRDGKLVE